MSWLILALVAAFVAGNVYVEAVNETLGYKWWRNELSDYLAKVRLYWLQDAAYAGLALAEVLMIFTHPGSKTYTIALALAAAGLVSVVVSALVRKLPGVGKWAEKWHVASAGVAFGAALVAEFVYLYDTPAVWIVIAGLVSTMAWQRFAPQYPALEEKSLTAFVLAALVAIVGAPL